jgi:hypothetical protein
MKRHFGKVCDKACVFCLYDIGLAAEKLDPSCPNKGWQPRRIQPLSPQLEYLLLLLAWSRRIIALTAPRLIHICDDNNENGAVPRLLVPSCLLLSSHLHLIATTMSEESGSGKPQAGEGQQ